MLTGLLFAVLLISSCDTREDYFLDLNKAPEIVLTKNGVVMEESIIDTLKIGRNKTINYEILDEEFLSLNYELSGNGIDVNIDNNTVSIQTTTKGKSEITLFTQDSFLAHKRRKVIIETIDNWFPVAKMKMANVAVVSPNEVEIDASTSYDADARFGGKITMYEYDLNNNVFQSPLSKIRYIFGSSGQKKIGVRVKDNEGAWSEWNVQYIIIN